MGGGWQETVGNHMATTGGNNKQQECVVDDREGVRHKILTGKVIFSDVKNSVRISDTATCWQYVGKMLDDMSPTLH